MDLTGINNPLLEFKSDMYTAYGADYFAVDYSLNGVSLSIARYDKYSSLAQTLYTQANDRLIEQKKTVKIVRGLAQSRYTFSRGAALGPWTGGSGNLRRWFVGAGQHSGYRPGTLRGAGF